MAATQSNKIKGTFGQWLSDRILRAMIWTVLRFPLRTRLQIMGRFTSHVVAPIAGYRKRAMDNLAYIHPDMSATERRQIADAVSDQFGRTFIEFYDLVGLMDRMSAVEIEGTGLKHIEQAHAEGRPVLLLTGHFGNYEAARVALVARGYDVGGLFRRMSNPYFNAHYTANMRVVPGIPFEQGRKGTIGLIRHLEKGGKAVIAHDVYDSRGVEIDFLGKPAPTLTSAADMALRTNALLVPYFAVRQADGMSFRVFIEEPIEHGDPVDMIRDATQRLEARIKDHPEQWFWIHRRWKPERQRKRAPARTGP
ncbi:MAG: lauroyl acyltransferase [Rhodobacteraceae bacterium]|nr:lauroyl acyltransferase [Paracoccaceae bacterium]